MARSGEVTFHHFSSRVSSGVVSAPTSSIKSSSWGWVKSALGVEKYLSVVLTSLCICTIFQILSWVLDCCLMSRANFCATLHNLSRFSLHQNRLLTWTHCLDWWKVIGLNLDLPLVGCDLKLNYRSWWPLVWLFQGQWSWWAVGPRGQCRKQPVGLSRQKSWLGWLGGLTGHQGERWLIRRPRRPRCPPPLFSPPFSGGLEIAPTLHLSLEIAGWLVWLQQFSEWITTCTESFCLLAISRGWPLADRFWQLHATPPINVASRSSLEGPLQGGGLGVS